MPTAVATIPKPAILVVCKDEIWYRCCGCESLNINGRDDDEVVCPDCGQVNIMPEIQQCGCEKCQPEELGNPLWVPADLQRLRVSFECNRCGAWENLGVQEAVEGGAPQCHQCDKDMVYCTTEMREPLPHKCMAGLVWQKVMEECGDCQHHPSNIGESGAVACQR